MISVAIKVDILAGTDIDSACKECIELSNKLNTHIEFNFNGVDIFVCHNSHVKDLVNEYFEKLQKQASGEKF